MFDLSGAVQGTESAVVSALLLQKMSIQCGYQERGEVCYHVSTLPTGDRDNELQILFLLVCSASLRHLLKDVTSLPGYSHIVWVEVCRWVRESPTLY